MGEGGKAEVPVGAETKDAAPDGPTTAYLNAFGKNVGGQRVELSVTRAF